MINSTNDLRPPAQWSRYNQKTHPDKIGFLFWAGEADMDKLNDVAKSVAAIMQTNKELSGMPHTLYSSEFYPTIRLTANYYAIRVFIGKYNYYQNKAHVLFNAKGWSNDIKNLLDQAKSELNNAIASLTEYERHFLEVLKLKEPLSKANNDDIQRDFVGNPSQDFLKSKLAEIEACMTNKTVKISID